MKVYIDGAVRGHQFGAGNRKGQIAVVIEAESFIEAEADSFIEAVGESRIEAEADSFIEDVGDVTNNQAEYLALIKALEIIKERGKHARIYSDSELLVKQFNGEYKVRNPNISPFYRKAKKLSEGLRVTVSWIPRERNLAGKLLEE